MSMDDGRLDTEYKAFEFEGQRFEAEVAIFSDDEDICSRCGDTPHDDDYFEVQRVIDPNAREVDLCDEIGEDYWPILEEARKRFDTTPKGKCSIDCLNPAERIEAGLSPVTQLYANPSAYTEARLFDFGTEIYTATVDWAEVDSLKLSNNLCPCCGKPADVWFVVDLASLKNRKGGSAPDKAANVAYAQYDAYGCKYCLGELLPKALRSEAKATI